RDADDLDVVRAGDPGPVTHVLAHLLVLQPRAFQNVVNIDHEPVPLVRSSSRSTKKLRFTHLDSTARPSGGRDPPHLPRHGCEGRAWGLQPEERARGMRQGQPPSCPARPLLFPFIPNVPVRLSVVPTLPA